MLNQSQREILGGVMSDLKRRDSDALSLFRVMPSQVRVLTEPASQILVRGGNRSGKSILGAAIVASAFRGKRLIAWENLTTYSERPLPYFRPPNRPQLIWTIGKGEKHIGSTIFRLLCKPGAFPILQDPVTGKIRAARNWQEKAIGQEQGLIAPPFIPAEEIDVSYNVAGTDYFNVIKHRTNGSRIESYVSNGDVKMGDPVDLIWPDEDIAYPAYVNEWLARLPDKKGRFLWTAWPWTSNWALVKMSTRAKEQTTRKNPDVIEVKLSYKDNPFIDDEEKRKAMEAWGASGSAELRSRVDGEFTLGESLMYPNFATQVHGLPREGSMAPDPLDDILRANQYEPPKNWTRYLAYDPGHTYSAILFAAVPPPELGDVVVLYDEIYVQCLDAVEVSERVKAKLAGVTFQDFIIDSHYARQTIDAMGKTRLHVYQDIWSTQGFRSVSSRGGFTFASDDVDAGCEAVRMWLTTRGDGSTQLRVIQHRCPNLIMEMQQYHKIIHKDVKKDRPANNQKDHLVDCLRYLAMHGCQYIPPPDVDLSAHSDPVFLAFQRHRDGAKGQSDGVPTIHCGAGRPRAAISA